ncbi:MAG: HlyD family efflux transporter periplasmic adaptor subunit [Clostridia bacterium]|nr:HlyD family efflux transporter periplasmic adaptor subunit [Clostridia bacterium]
MKKLLTLAALTLALILCAASALGATANASVVAPVTHQLTAPFSGMLKPFSLTIGDTVAEGELLLEMDTTPVYAQQAGIVAAVFAAEGDDAAGVMARTGALAFIEPALPLYIAASTQNAYDKDENRYIHAGETLYLKSGEEKGEGRVLSVSGSNYVVEILSGDYDLNDTIRCFRESDHEYKSEVGRGKAARFEDYAVAGQGRVAAVHVQPGDEVAVGDLLFELVDAQCPVGAPLTLNAPASGALTALYTVSGGQVMRGQLLAEITDLTELELSVEVDEIDLSRVAVGSMISYTLDAYPDEILSGIVSEIRPIGVRRQNAAYYDVRVSLPAGKVVYPGMNATAVIGE